MKHELSETITLYGWFILASLLSLVAVFAFDGKTSVLDELPGWSMISIIVASILAGAALMIFLLKRCNNKLVLRWMLMAAMVFVAGMGIQGFKTAWNITQWYTVPLSFAVGALYGWSSQRIAEDKPFLRWQEVVNNVVMALCIAVAAGTIGQVLTPLSAMILIIVVGIYDAIAVWKLSSMQTMALGLIGLGIVPAIVTKKRHLPKGKKVGLAIIGNGDVLFVGMTAGVFFKQAPQYAWPILMGMFGAVWVLLLASEPKKFYPAIPFIIAGAVIGLTLSFTLGYVAMP